MEFNTESVENLFKDKPFKDLIMVVRVLDNPMRQNILVLLAKQPSPVKQIHTTLNIPQPLASQHLSILRDIGLVTYEKNGHHRYYKNTFEHLTTVIRNMHSTLSGTA